MVEVLVKNCNIFWVVIVNAHYHHWWLGAITTQRLPYDMVMNNKAHNYNVWH
jgi:hypothetical protein